MNSNIATTPFVSAASSKNSTSICPMRMASFFMVRAGLLFLCMRVVRANVMPISRRDAAALILEPQQAYQPAQPRPTVRIYQNA